MAILTSFSVKIRVLGITIPRTANILNYPILYAFLKRPFRPFQRALRAQGKLLKGRSHAKGGRTLPKVRSHTT